MNLAQRIHRNAHIFRAMFIVCAGLCAVEGYADPRMWKSIGFFGCAVWLLILALLIGGKRVLRQSP